MEHYAQTRLTKALNNFSKQFIPEIYMYLGQRNYTNMDNILLSWKHKYHCLYISAEVKIGTNIYPIDIEDFRVFGMAERQTISKEDRLYFDLWMVTTLSVFQASITRNNSVFVWTNYYSFCSVHGCSFQNRPRISQNNLYCDEHNVNVKLPNHLKSKFTPKKKEKPKKRRGGISKSLRYDILERDGFKCKYCGTKPEIDNNVKLHVDHIVPISKGGKTEPDNLQVLCQSCNLGKSNKLPKHNNSFQNEFHQTP